MKKSFKIDMLDITVQVEVYPEKKFYKKVFELTKDASIIGLTYVKERKKGRMTFNIMLPKLDFLDHNTIAHEVAHTSLNICEFIEAKIDPSNPEFFCYLNGFIAGNVYKILTDEV